ncbi:prop effector ProQ [Paucibacter sp. KBW04]|uniref:ProQ/FINO family protein n=1 Tax=Paucibacter sp. KBW04 TaxID=2153361 RepID=UPI000F57FD52|nr:ProQ/FinO family protein [Paucibacter sp. KBW04]RQO55926.1 prop effector ProQ [Paucibacter sp. KBW04]
MNETSTVTPDSTSPLNSDDLTSLPAAQPDAAPEAGETVETASAAAAPAAAELSPAAVAAKLKTLFPALFGGNGFKPVKLRVQVDIQARAPGQFSKAQLSGFLRRYTGNTGYLIALGRATHRFDLDGNQAGELSEEHRTAAREELARRRAVQQERVELEQAQARNRAGLLHDYERTTLTLANFCALKGVTEAELPGLLEIAKAERAAQPPREARPQFAPRNARPNQRDAREPRDNKGADRAPRGPRNRPGR